jgi:hypothetical protein
MHADTSSSERPGTEALFGLVRQGLTEVLGLPATRRGWAGGIPVSTPGPCLRRVVD